MYIVYIVLMKHLVTVYFDLDLGIWMPNVQSMLAYYHIFVETTHFLKEEIQLWAFAQFNDISIETGGKTLGTGLKWSVYKTCHTYLIV